MDPSFDRRILIGAGAAVAVAAGVVAAVMVTKGGGDKPTPTTGERGLQVEMGLDEAKLDPKRTLRCFVGGQFVGLATLADCAQRNGVAAQALDVGLDQTGELAAATGGADLQPIPAPETLKATTPLPPAPPAKVPTVSVTPASGAPSDSCLRFGSDGWKDAGGSMTLNTCVQALFQSRCLRPGEAAYGRWGGQTLRLVPGKVETAADNRNFHTIAEQNPRDCSIAPLPQ